MSLKWKLLQALYSGSGSSVFGPSMSELIDRILKSSKHEEQAFNACAGILHRVKAIPKGIAEKPLVNALK